MYDNLQDICRKYGIKLIYTNNKSTFLSTGQSNGAPTIRAHIYFKDCPLDIAMAIEDFYVLQKNPKESYQLLQSYLLSRHKSKKFKIAMPKKAFIELSRSYDNSKSESKTMSEMKVSEMVFKTFFDKPIIKGPNQSIKVQESDIVELSITVE